MKVLKETMRRWNDHWCIGRWGEIIIQAVGECVPSKYKECKYDGWAEVASNDLLRTSAKSHDVCISLISAAICPQD